MPAVGGAIVALLVVALLTREASGAGVLEVTGRLRRALDLSIVLLAALFVVVVATHLLSL
jgi:hypothetical protein